MKFIHVSIILFTASCFSSVGFTQTGNTFSKYEGFIEVYFEEPDREFDQIGVLSIAQDYQKKDVEAIKKLQDRARDLGANAIVIQSIRDFYSEENELYKGETKIIALAIRIEAD